LPKMKGMNQRLGSLKYSEKESYKEYRNNKQNLESSFIKNKIEQHLNSLYPGRPPKTTVSKTVSKSFKTNNLETLAETHKV
jgi:glucose-6-phosphate isomerase